MPQIDILLTNYTICTFGIFFILMFLILNATCFDRFFKGYKVLIKRKLYAKFIVNKFMHTKLLLNKFYWIN